MVRCQKAGFNNLRKAFFMSCSKPLSQGTPSFFLKNKNCVWFARNASACKPHLAKKESSFWTIDTLLHGCWSSQQKMARVSRDLDKMIHELVVQLEQGIVLQKISCLGHTLGAAGASFTYTTCSSCLRFCFASSRICILSSQIQTKDWRFIMLHIYYVDTCTEEIRSMLFLTCFWTLPLFSNEIVGSQNQKLWFIWTSCCKLLPAGNQPDTLRDIATQGLENHSFKGLSDPTKVS